MTKKFLAVICSITMSLTYASMDHYVGTKKEMAKNAFYATVATCASHGLAYLLPQKYFGLLKSDLAFWGGALATIMPQIILAINHFENPRQNNSTWVKSLVRVHVREGAGFEYPVPQFLNIAASLLPLYLSSRFLTPRMFKA